ncbi:hypothetical protein [Micromonospora tarensis]|uniref:Uncharacterized protein n=1 Tax=Micromonospora tarensis TaxID=2806100 RepID=A0ABS1YD72_9ACTN|nr:hypothetical protein [Micromonospora tarensis]MBM0275204.1 hypothetical protein [Micromonospora tarensis]
MLAAYPDGRAAHPDAAGFGPRAGATAAPYPHWSLRSAVHWAATGLIVPVALGRVVISLGVGPGRFDRLALTIRVITASVPGHPVPDARACVAVGLGVERTLGQGVGFGFRRLTDIIRGALHRQP